jgi:hypothetical protein
MWILPKSIISAFAPGTEELISDSDEFSRVAEQSLMWRSKPSPSRTWSQRWKRENWMRHLSGRTLRHSTENRFAAWWTSCQAATRVNRSQQQASDEAPKTQDISGRFCAEQFELFSPDESSSKMSRDTSRWDSPQSSAIWTKMVTEQRGEYSARRNAARATRESESSSSGGWPTPGTSQAHIDGQGRSTVEEVAKQKKFHLSQRTNKSGEIVKRDNGKTHQATLASAVMGAQMWPTASARDWKDTPGMSKTRPDRNGLGRIDQLARSVYHNDSPQDQDNRNSIGRNPGRLSPNWVEQLMGVPVGWTQLPTEWTDFDSSATELSRQQQQKRGQS